MSIGLEFAQTKTAGIFRAMAAAGKGAVNFAGRGIGAAANAVGGGVGAAADAVGGGARLAAIGALGAFAASRAIDKVRADINKKALIEDMMVNDPILKQEDPAKVLDYYATINTFAPHVAKDKNAVRELITSFIRFGRVDMPTIEMLTKTEKNMAGIDGSASMLFSPMLAEGISHIYGKVPE